MAAVSLHQSMGSDFAVDGRKSNLSGYGGQCAVSPYGHPTSEWRVDLLEILSIVYINVQYRTENVVWGIFFFNMPIKNYIYLVNEIIQKYKKQFYFFYSITDTIYIFFYSDKYNGYYTHYRGFSIYVSNTTKKED